MPLTTAYLALGSNLGDRLAQMRAALELLEAEGVRVVSCSPVYQNRAIGMGDAEPFLNAVVEVRTELAAEVLLDVCLAVENRLGRVRSGGWAPRTLDVDILLFGQTSLCSERLSLPHPRIAERDFVLQPLSDLNPELQLFGQSVQDWLQHLPERALELYPAPLR